MSNPFVFGSDPATESQMLDDLAAADQRRLQYQASTSAAVAQAIGASYKANPQASPGVHLAIGQAVGTGQISAQSAQDATLNALRTQMFQSGVDKFQAPDSSTPKNGQAGPGPSPYSPGTWWNAAGTVAKGAARGVAVAAQTGSELVQNAISHHAPMSADTIHAGLGTSKADEQLREHLSGESSLPLPASRVAAGDTTDLTIKTGQGLIPSTGNVLQAAAGAAVAPFAATTAGQVVQQAASGNGVDLGSGWFPKGTVAQQQADAARAYRGLIPGTTSAWTGGRALASSVTQSGTVPYRVLSGLTDAAIVWESDPVAKALGKFKEIRKAATALSPSILAEAADAAEAAGFGVAGEPKAIQTGVGAAADRAQGAVNDLQSLIGRSAEKAADSASHGSASTLEAAGGMLLDAERPATNPTMVNQFFDSTVWQRIADTILSTDDPLAKWNAFGRSLPADVASAVNKATNIEDLEQAIAPALGTSIPRFADIPAAGIGYSAKMRVLRAMPGFITNDAGEMASRVFGKVSAGMVDLSTDATPQDITKSLNKMDGALRNVEVPYADRSKIMGMLVDAAADPSNRSATFAATTAFKTMMRTYMVNANPDLGSDVLDNVVKIFADKEASLYGVDKMGQPTDHGLLYALTGSTDLSATASPGLLSEQFASKFMLPDPQVVRRLTSQFGKAIAYQTGDRAGELKLGPAIVDSIFGKLFPAATTMRFATGLRMAADVQGKLAASGELSAASPFDVLLTVFGARNNAMRLGLNPADYADMIQDASHSFYSAMDDPSAIKGVRGMTGEYDTVMKNQAAKYLDGSEQTVRQLNHDPIARQVAAGKSTDDIMDWLHSEGQQGAYQKYVDLGNAGLTAPTGTGFVKVPADFTDDANMRHFIDTNIRGRVDTIAGGNEDIRNAIAYNRLPYEDPAVAYEMEKPNTDLTFQKAGTYARGADGSSSKWIGATVKDADGNVGVVVDDLGNGKSVVQYGADSAFQDGSATPGLRGVLESHMASDGSPAGVKWNRPMQGKMAMPGLTDRLTRWARTVSHTMYEIPYQKLTASPAVSAAFYDRMAQLAPHLSPEEAGKLMQSIGADAADKGFADKVSDFLGGDKRLDAVIDGAGRASGTMTLEQAQNLAKGYAVDHINDLLYDPANKTNLEQSLRIIAPFASAWRQVLTNWVKVIAENPAAVDRFSRFVDGAQSAGFFHTDPTTGDNMFTVPGSSWFVNKLTGLNAPVQMPVSGFSIAGNFLPTVGPAVQYPASLILKGNSEVPQVIQNLVLPYGQTNTNDDNSNIGGAADALAQFLVPSWAQKVWSAATGKPDSSSIYGNTYSSVVQQLATSGDYDLTKPDDQRRMLDDAKTKATMLVGLRALGQFVSPSAPSYAYKANTSQGDVYSAQLAADLTKLYQQDPSTAVAKFLQTYGDEASIFLAGKTKAINGGLSPSSEFGAWEASHSGFMSSHKAVAGYFAPVGSNFDFAVYDAQLANGDRKKLTGQEMIDASQTADARTQYNAARDQFGTKPTQAQRDWLAKYKAGLQKDYPGYATTPAWNPNEFSQTLNQVSQAANDPAVADTPVGQATRDYLKARDQAVAIAQQRAGNNTAGLTSAKDADLRTWLQGVATGIIRDVPTFQRLFDGVLSQEVEQ